ncbi:MAG: DUF6265 family protein [Longimicrobiaceae bacterium]
MPSLRAFLPLLAIALTALPAAAQEPARPLAALAFMAGCWRGDAGVDKTIEEQWTAADSDVMLATTRYLDDNTGRTRAWEFSRIVAESAGIVLYPAPGGTQRGRFRLTQSTPGSARFEDPTHDFPKRITYRRVDARRLTVLVDNADRDERAQEFRLEAVACPGNAETRRN